jgi:hypothetical protein
MTLVLLVGAAFGVYTYYDHMAHEHAHGHGIVPHPAVEGQGEEADDEEAVEVPAFSFMKVRKQQLAVCVCSTNCLSAHAASALCWLPPHSSELHLLGRACMAFT